MTKNRTASEIHGCIVCAKLFNVYSIYAADGKLVDCTVTSPGGHRLPDEQHPLVACNRHSAADIDHAYGRWQARNKDSVEE